MTLHGDKIFVFEFASSEDRVVALDHGCFFYCRSVVCSKALESTN